MGRPAFRAKRGSPSPNPNVSPKGSRNVGIKVEPNDTANPRAIPSDFGRPSFERPGTVTGSPKY